MQRNEKFYGLLVLKYVLECVLLLEERRRVRPQLPQERSLCCDVMMMTRACLACSPFHEQPVQNDSADRAVRHAVADVYQ